MLPSGFHSSAFNSLYWSVLTLEITGKIKRNQINISQKSQSLHLHHRKPTISQQHTLPASPAAERRRRHGVTASTVTLEPENLDLAPFSAIPGTTLTKIQTEFPFKGKDQLRNEGLIQPERERAGSVGTSGSIGRKQVGMGRGAGRGNGPSDFTSTWEQV